MQRLQAGKCELCGAEGNIEVHHVKRLKRPARQETLGNPNDWTSEKDYGSMYSLSQQDT